MMHVTDLRGIGLFDGLSDDQLAELVDGGTEVPVLPGVELFHEGDHADYWWVLVDGMIELVRHSGREDTLVGRMDAPGRWAGGFRAWDEHGVYLATGRGLVAGRVLRVPATALRRLTTAWFPFGGHLIEGLYGTARRIEAMARQRDSLVTLGTLAAGLAHELNNPAAAALRAVDALDEVSKQLLTALTGLGRDGIAAGQLLALDELRREVGPPPDDDPVALADREDALSAWLHRHGIDDDWLFAPPLAAAGVDVPWCDRAAAILADGELAIDGLDDGVLEPGLTWLASTFAMAGLLAEVRESTRRVADLVAAVRSYSQLDRASLQHIHVTDGIESTLVMLGHKLRNGVRVVRSYDAELPRIEAYAGELNQVWTNLIDNAVDAMAGAGTLTITTRAEDDAVVVVEIGDTGSGMTPAVAARAFEAFFTTKDVGKGTGLGLDISRRIVAERHGGTIEIDTGPGGTTMRVRLPRRAPDALRDARQVGS